MKSIQPSDRYLNLSNSVEDVADFCLGVAPPSMTVTATSGTLSYGPTGLSITPQASTDNALGTAMATTKTYLPSAGRSNLFSTRFQFAEAATNAANLYVGMTSSAAAALMGDNGAGPAASYSGAGFFKKDGGLNWWVGIANGSTKIEVELLSTNTLTRRTHVAGSANFQELDVDFKPKTSTKVDIMFRIDNQNVYKVTDFVWTSMVAMGASVGIKNGSTTAETAILSFLQSVRNRS